jgi:hypothetical protein
MFFFGHFCLLRREESVTEYFHLNFFCCQIAKIHHQKNKIKNSTGEVVVVE